MQNCNSLCSVSESNKQNPRDRTLDLPFFFCCKHIPSLKNLPSPAPNESSAYWFQGNFAASFVLKFCLREFLLPALVNRFELRCELKMLLYYKVCPCSSSHPPVTKYARFPIRMCSRGRAAASRPGSTKWTPEPNHSADRTM